MKDLYNRTVTYFSEFIDRCLAFILDVLGFFLVLFYRMFGASENRRLLRMRVIHQSKRLYRLFCFHLSGRIPFVPGLRAKNDVELSTLLHDVLYETQLWWQCRTMYMEPYVKFEEWMVAAIYSRNIVDVRYTGSTRETTGSLHYSETATDIDMMYIYRDFNISEKLSLLEHKHSGVNQLPTVLNEEIHKGPLSLSSETRSSSLPTFQNCHLTLVNSHKPGYVFLKACVSKENLVETYREIARKGEFDSALNVFSLIDDFEKYVIADVPHSFFDEEKFFRYSYDDRNHNDNNVLLLRSDYFRHMHEQFNRARFSGYMRFKQRGPASNIVWNVAALPQRLMLGHMDIVFALHCQVWPSQADEWFKRYRLHSYPPPKLIKEIHSYGVDIVPKSSYTRPEPSTSIFSWFETKDFKVEENDYQFQWRLSFSIAEIMLVKTWNSTQKCVYRFIKTLRNDYFSEYGITSYALKNIMFYFLEETPTEFWNMSILTIINKFLEHLTRCCEEKRCPHYFIKVNNLFHGLNHNDLCAAALKCKSLQDNWFLTILLSDGIWFEVNVRGYSARFYELSRTPCCPHKSNSSTSGVYLLQSNANVNDLEAYYKSTFKMYYCFKVQNEVMKHLRGSYISPNYNTQVVLTALFAYLERFPLSKMTVQEKIISSHISWSLIKCLRYYRQKLREESGNRNMLVAGNKTNDVVLRQINDVIEKYMKPNETSKRLLAAEYLLQQNRSKALQSLESLEPVDWSGLNEMMLETHSPIFLNKIDQPYLQISATFDFKLSQFFVPSALLKAAILNDQKSRNRKGQEYEILLKKASELWKSFPYHVKSIQRYKTIIIPLAKTLHGKLKSQK